MTPDRAPDRPTGPDLAGQSVLVTGGTGFIGSHLVRRLVHEGADVHVLKRPGSLAWRITDLAGRLTIHTGSLAETDRLEGILRDARPDAVLHLAGATDVRVLDADLDGLERSVEVNVMGFLRLVRAAHRLARPPRRIVRACGLEAYGTGPIPYREDQREAPVSPYSASQTGATHYAQMLAPHLPFDLVSLRLALVYGPAQAVSFFIPALIHHCLAGRPFPMTSGHHRRDLLFVDDAVDAFCRAAVVPGLDGAVLNVSSGEEHSMADVADLVEALCGRDGVVVEAENRPRRVDLPHLVADNTRARRSLHWRPGTSLRDGLHRTIDWYRAYAAPAAP